MFARASDGFRACFGIARGLCTPRQLCMCVAAAHSLAGDSKLSSWIIFGTNSICAPYMPKTAEPVLMKSEGEMPKTILVGGVGSE